MPVSSKALEHLKAANLLFDHELYRDSVSRAYYAVFTVAWDYVGDSTTGEWNNRSISAGKPCPLGCTQMASSVLSLSR